MSHREGYRRERSRSPPRDRFRERSRSRDRDDNRDNRDRQRDTKMANTNRLNTMSNIDKLKAKAALEQTKKERLALIKNITSNYSSDEEKETLKDKRMRERNAKKTLNEAGENIEDNANEEEEEQEDMMDVLGFSGFGTTKGKQLDDNVYGAASGSVSKHKKRQYRQYMNRRGGFNRPLQKMN